MMSGEKSAVIHKKQSPDLQSLKTPDPAISAHVPHVNGFDRNAFFQRHALTLIIFLLSLFFIITVTPPGLYTNDEWITANQLHQLDIGHQVTFSEGKYGVTKDGIVSAYFTYRQNLLMYSLALPLSALPVIKLFGLFGDNFRLIIIMIWSLCLVLIALLLEICYPAYARVRGVRLLFPALLLSLLFFMGNILTYKKFLYSVPDAPFEVAALVLTNHLFFALAAAIVFETCRTITKDIWSALFGTFACIACSSYIFWSGTAKDHMLTALVLAFVIFFFIQYISHSRQRDAALSFICSGLLIWVRPEVGFYVTIFTGLFFCMPLIWQALKKEQSLSQTLKSCIPVAGVFLGGIPFFINNILISKNWFIPVFDLPRSSIESGTATIIPLPIDQVVSNPQILNEAAGLSLFDTIPRVWEMIMRVMFKGFSFDNIVSGFYGVMVFPENGNIGFLVMCPLIVIALIALVLWNRKISQLPADNKEIGLFLFVMIIAIFLGYLPQFYSMNISLGVLPDMRYLSPAYLPCGLFSIFILTKVPFFTSPRNYLTYGLLATVVIIPVLFFLMVFVHPFGDQYAGYAAFFKFIILLEVLVCSGLMIVSRMYPEDNWFFSAVLPYLIVLLLITVFSFQFMLASLYGMIMKTNGYPFWIPLVREWIDLFIVVQYVPAI